MVRLLDLFSGAGGGAAGYERAGFDVVGVDNRPQPRYPFEFHQADALTFPFDGFDVIHASPPCQHYSTVAGDARQNHGASYPDLIEAIRGRLRGWGGPYVIENVINSPLIDPVRLCGSSFGLDLRRHRLFESNVNLRVPPCDHAWQTPRFQSLDGNMVKRGRLASVVGVHGNCNYAGEFALRCKAMGIDWMTNAELTQAIPPVYTECLGRQLVR